MILYFSGTGNTKWVAETLAKLLDDTVLDLSERIRRSDYSPLNSRQPFILCSPVYVCEMPRFLTAFLKKTAFTGNREVYCVFTSGGYTGISGILAEKLFRQKRMIFKGYAEFKMPRNYIANNMYSELSDEEILERIHESEKQLPSVAEAIQQRKPLQARHVWFFEKWITVPFNPVWCRLRQGTRLFTATERCISCGKCERLCPLNVIRMTDGKPVWQHRSCAHCMSCIQNCPVEAIEYGEITPVKKRYRFEKYCEK